MLGSIRSFEELFCPQKPRLNVQLKVKLPSMTDWQTLWQDRCPHRAPVVMSVNPQKNECVSRYSVSGHLQTFAAGLTLSTSPKFTAMQNCHNIAQQQSKSASSCTLKSSFRSCSLKFLLFHTTRILSCSNLIYI